MQNHKLRFSFKRIKCLSKKNPYCMHLKKLILKNKLMFYEKFTYLIIVQLVLRIYILKYILCIHYEQLCLLG
jgi:hypothetical protein